MDRKPRGLRDVPAVDLAKWLAQVTALLGPACESARIYRAELNRRDQAAARQEQRGRRADGD